MPIVTAGLAGLVFGIGLILSGMADPSKVLAFLDLAGVWNPSLLWVMGGAVAVGLIAFSIAKRRTRTWIGQAFHLPTARHLDRRLVGGSLLFGIGWGIAGFCPGPALVNLGLVLSQGMAQSKAAWFCLSMLAGMAIHDLLERTSSRPLPKAQKQKEASHV